MQWWQRLCYGQVLAQPGGDLGLAGCAGFYGRPSMVGDAAERAALPTVMVIAGADAATPVEDQLATARTTVFTALVFMQLFNALNARSDLASAFDHLFTNRWLWASLAFGTLAQVAVVHVPFLQAAFGTVALGGGHWLLAVGAGDAILAFEEVGKVFRRARARSAAR